MGACLVLDFWTALAHRVNKAVKSSSLGGNGKIDLAIFSKGQ